MQSLQQQLREFVSGWGGRVPECNAEDCAGTRRAWQRISTGAGSVCVHGLRYCFPQCFARELQRRFDQTQLARGAQRRPAHRMPLGLLMLSRGRLTDSQLRHALEEQKLHPGRRIGECMQRLGYVSEPQVIAALATQWCCPVLKALPQQIAECGVPMSFLKRFQMLPVHFSAASRALHLAFARDVEYPALLAIEKMLDCKTQACLTTPSGLHAAFERVDKQIACVEKEFEGTRSAKEMTCITVSYAGRLGADDIRIAACGEIVWVKIDGSKEVINLVFNAMSARAA